MASVHCSSRAGAPLERRLVSSFLDAARGRFVNESNEHVWVKFHFRGAQGVENLTDAEAEALVGGDRESHQRDLFESIERDAFRAGRCSTRS